jgi:predicted RNase H-like HicB family nuclease
VRPTPIHLEVLHAALRLCRRRGGWTFRPDEIVRLLPSLNASSVRTHIVSRCCVNAPRNHPHAWDYFKRLERAVYEILPKHRSVAPEPRRPTTAVGETKAVYRARPRTLGGVVHAIVVRDGAWFVAECLEVAVVTQGRSLDETAEALREAVALHLEGEDAAALGLTRSPRLVLQYETSVSGGGAPA